MNPAASIQGDRAQDTLDAIGDAVLSTDLAGNVAYLNPAAEELTGWGFEEARGRPLAEVFRVLDSATRLPPVRTATGLADGKDALGAISANHMLLRRDGVEIAIEDSADAIRARDGRVIGAVIVFRDVAKARAVALQASHRAQHDFLTDLPDPVLLDDRIAQALALAQRNGKQLAVLFIDLDRFKRVNDSLGHAVGDQVLRSVALRLKACVRASDTVSRKGGDEFVVLLSEIAQPEAATRTADKIVAALAAPHRLAGQDLVVTASVGIAIYPADGVNARTLLEHADTAMYRAKEASTVR